MINTLAPGSEFEYGMTYRQWLAGMALAGLLAQNGPRTPVLTILEAVKHADDLIAELDKEAS